MKRFITILSAMLFTVFLAVPAGFAGGHGNGTSVATDQQQGQSQAVNNSGNNIAGAASSGSSLNFKQNFEGSEFERDFPILPGVPMYQLYPGSAPFNAGGGFNVIPIKGIFGVKSTFSWKEARRLRNPNVIINGRIFLPPSIVGRTTRIKVVSSLPECYYPVGFVTARVEDGQTDTIDAGISLLYYSLSMGGNRFLPVKEGADFERLTKGDSESAYGGLGGMLSNITGVGFGVGGSKSQNKVSTPNNPFIAGWVLWVPEEGGEGR